MYSIYLVVKKIPRMLQGKIQVFCYTFVSLGGHIFGIIEKFGSHV